MKLVCPSCGAIHSAEGWSTDADARQCLRIVAELPTPVSRQSLSYLALFRPGSGRGLTWAKALRLLGELKVMVADACIEWDGKTPRPNSATAWAEAMERVVASPPRRLPLKSHGYLRAIAYEIADGQDRGREVEHNRDERNGTLRKECRGTVRCAPSGDLEPMSVELMRSITDKKLGRRR